jgi:hypothetical protein
MEYYREFLPAILHLGVHSIALLTLSPLTLAGSFDLHVLAMPPAFNLSQDQTLHLIFFYPTDTLRCRSENFKEGRLNQYLRPNLAA